MEALATSSESKTQYLQQTIGWRREATVTVCAFPNQFGTKVLFNVPLAKSVDAMDVWITGKIGSSHE